MRNESYEWEVSLKDMIFTVIYQWKKIILVACALAICLGGLQGVRTMQRNAGIDPDNDQNYLNQLATYEHQLYVKEGRLAALEGMLENQKKYLEESVLMQLDVRETYETMVSLFFDTDYQVMTDKTVQNTDYTATVYAFYKSALQNNAIYNSIAEGMGIQPAYLKELVTVSAMDDSYILNITVWHSDSATSNLIMDQLMEYIGSMKSQAVEMIGEHSVNEIMRTTGIYVGDFIGNRQGTEDDRLLDLEEQVFASKADLEKLAVPGKPAAASVSAAAIKWGILGGIAGVAVMAVLYCCIYLFCNMVYSGNELSSRLGIKVLGAVVDRKRRYDPISGFFRNTEGRINENSDDNYALLAENIRSYGNGAEMILVTGSAAADKVGALTEKLQGLMPETKLVFCGSVLNNKDAVRGLNQCAGVVLVEKSGKSRYANIIREVERVEDAGKPVVGCIVLD